MKRVGLCAIAMLCWSSTALAQSTPGDAALPSAEDIASRDTVTVGLGAGLVPDYEGSDDYRLIPVGAVRGKVGGISFITRGTYLYVDLVPHSGKVDFNAGPIIGARFNGRRHSKDPVVKLLPQTRTAIEAGGFVGISAHGLTNPYDTLAFRIDVVHDIAGTHRSTTVSPNVEFSTPLSRSTYVNASVGLEFVSNKYADYYYSITPAGALASGLPLFDAGGGMKDWKAGLLLNQSLGGDLLHGLSLFGFGQYSKLVGDFKRSPIVAQRGSASQWLGAIGLAYTW